jgi:hypothetical protein
MLAQAIRQGNEAQLNQLAGWLSRIGIDVTAYLSQAGAGPATSRPAAEADPADRRAEAALSCGFKFGEADLIC